MIKIEHKENIEPHSPYKPKVPKLKVAQVQLGVTNKVKRIEINAPQPKPRAGVSQKVSSKKAF